MCHNTDTMWHTENRIPRYKPQTTIKSIPKFLALRIKRSNQDTGYGERMQVKTKGTHLVLGLLLVVGIVMSAFSFTVPTTCRRPSTKMSAFITVPTTCSRPSTKMSAFSFWFLLCRLLVVGPVLK